MPRRKLIPRYDPYPKDMFQDSNLSSNGKALLYVFQVHASSSENPDVLAAVRGGGSALGVVTSLTFTAYDVSSYTGGAIVLSDDDNCTNFR